MISKAFDWLHSFDEPQDPELLKDFQAWASKTVPDRATEQKVKEGWEALDRKAVRH